GAPNQLWEGEGGQEEARQKFGFSDKSEAQPANAPRARTMASLRRAGKPVLGVGSVWPMVACPWKRSA
ncbi:MAG: hypothetical protein ACKOS8_18330, partial [Gemmataceae bacterium]